MRPRAVAAALVLLVTDVAAVAGSYALAFALRGWVVSGLFGLLPDPMPFVSMARRAYLLLVFVPVLAYEGLYTKRFVDWEETRRCFRGVLVASAGVVIMVFALRYLELSRIVMAMALVIALVAVPVARVLVRELLARTRLLSRPLVLVGGGPAADAFSRELARHPSVGYEVAGQVERASPQEPVERLLERAVEAAGGAILAVFPDSFAPEELAAVIRYAERRLSDIMMVPSAAPLRAQSVDIEQVGSALVMKYRYNLLRPLNRYVKRAIEVPACAVLLVLLSPLLGLLAVLVRLSSRGPALFRQPRVGRGRRTFACLKFRTMYTDAEGRLRQLLAGSEAVRREWETYARITDDPRVTQIGRVLRRSSLDELPQLWNVLAGDMALVGPRPYLPRETDQVGEYLDAIVRVRPGLTGLWQVSGRSALPFQERVMLDEYYIRNWSVWLDFSILLRTFWVVVSGRGSY